MVYLKRIKDRISFSSKGKVMLDRVVDESVSESAWSAWSTRRAGSRALLRALPRA